MTRWSDPLADDEAPDPLYTALVSAGPGDLPDVLVGLLGRPAWHQQAACRGMSNVFFSGVQSEVEKAKAVCGGCPVVAECRDAGAGELGVWGGQSEVDRRRLVRSRSAPPAA